MPASMGCMSPKGTSLNTIHQLTQCCGATLYWFRSGSDFPIWCRSRSGSGSSASLYSFTFFFKYFFGGFFFVSVIGVVILYIKQYIEIFCTKLFSWALLSDEVDTDPGTGTDPDRQVLDEVSDPTKWCRSGRISVSGSKSTYIRWLLRSF